uniref:BLOC-1-related complex subunit 7 n=1 Tax=Rhabditophanes sp. KR3021 TaxID=114890 RepID=A0AC35TWY1_9BILA
MDITSSIRQFAGIAESIFRDLSIMDKMGPLRNEHIRQLAQMIDQIRPLAHNASNFLQLGYRIRQDSRVLQLLRTNRELEFHIQCIEQAIRDADNIRRIIAQMGNIRNVTDINTIDRPITDISNLADNMQNTRQEASAIENILRHG